MIDMKKSVAYICFSIAATLGVYGLIASILARHLFPVLALSFLAFIFSLFVKRDTLLSELGYASSFGFISGAFVCLTDGGGSLVAGICLFELGISVLIFAHYKLDRILYLEIFLIMAATYTTYWSAYFTLIHFKDMAPIISAAPSLLLRCISKTLVDGREEIRIKIKLVRSISKE